MSNPIYYYVYVDEEAAANEDYYFFEDESIKEIQISSAYDVHAFSLLWTTIGIIVLICTLFGNSIVFYAVYATKALHNVTNYIIACLAVGHMLLAITFMPFLIRQSYDDNNFTMSDTLCIVSMTLYEWLTILSNFHICIMSIDRAMMILFAFYYYPARTNIKTVVIISIIWILSVLLVIPIIPQLQIPLSKSTLKINKGVCTFDDTAAYTHILFVTGTYLPGLLIITSSICVLFSVCIRMQKTTESKRYKKEMKMIQMVLVVILVYVLLTLPFAIFRYCYKPLIKFTYIREIQRLVNWLSVSIGAVNPWIYYFFRMEYKNVFTRTFSTLFCANRRVSQPSIMPTTHCRTLSKE